MLFLGCGAAQCRQRQNLQQDVKPRLLAFLRCPASILSRLAGAGIASRKVDSGVGESLPHTGFFCAVWPLNRRMRPKIRLCVDYLAQHMLPPWHQ